MAGQKKFSLPKEDASSPPIYLESIFTSLMIDSHQGKDVAIFNIPGAYLNSNTQKEKFIILKIEDEFVDIMCKVYRKLSTGTITTDFESPVWMYEVCTTMVRPIHKNFQIP